MAVRREEVVVVALEPVAAADVERGGLAAEPGPPLVHVDRMAGLCEPVRGHQAGDSGSDDGDPHLSRFALSRTTYSGRRLTSS